MGADKPSELTLAELAEKTGIPARTIRYYISRGLMAGPSVAGRGASYGDEHLERIEKIKGLQAKRLTLAEIARVLEGGAPDGGPGVSPVPPPTAWWNYSLAPDVVVSVRSDSAPWRLHRIQKVLGEMVARLSEPSHPEED